MKSIKNSLLIFFIIPVVAFSQETEKKDSPYQLGLSLFPVSYKVKAHEGFKHIYKTKTGFGTRITLTRSFTKNFSLTSGLGYTHLSYKVNYAFIFMDSLDPNIPRSASIRMGYLDIPLIGQVSVSISEKMKLQLAAGVMYSILIHEDDKTLFEDNSIRNSGFSNKTIISLPLLFSWQIILSKHFGISTEADYRYFFRGFDFLMNQRPKAMQLGVGITYNF
ncbi:MAG: hypothetical protein HJHJAOHD_00455 [Flavobacteriales bacterium]|nr:hypothetical protein [Flavobacteriales bacterium]